MPDRTEPIPATEGDLYVPYDRQDESFPVGPKCEANNGYWLCVTHGKAFDAPMPFYDHTQNYNYSCRVAWNCFDHGPEVP